MTEDSKSSGIDIDGHTFMFRKQVPMEEINNKIIMIKSFADSFFLDPKAGQKENPYTLFVRETSVSTKGDFLGPLIAKENDEWTFMEELIDHYKVKYPDSSKTSAGIAMAGYQAPMVQKLKNRDLEKFWQVEYDEAKQQNKYRVKPEYLDAVRKGLTPD